MKKQEALFLQQSCNDALDDYHRTLTQESFIHWDYIILTASDEQQAEGYRKQIEYRIQSGRLSPWTRYVVLPDPDGKRVGSGGATLGVIKYLKSCVGQLDGLRVMVIHSGGDSKRVPQYSALGKLFSPVPRLVDSMASTLFDEIVIAMAGVPNRIREGILLLSGDALLLFNPLQIDFSGQQPAVLSFKEDVAIGKNHGVFLGDTKGVVKQFLHKQTVESLKEKGAVNSSDRVDIDTGAVLFPMEVVNALYSLIERDENLFINENVRLNLYGDFLYPMASDATLEQFLREKGELENSELLTAARRAVWEALNGFTMKLLRLAPAKFIHFGTTHEVRELMTRGVDDYSYLGWGRQISSSVGDSSVSSYMSVLPYKAVCGEDVYLEVSNVQPGAHIGAGSILSFVDVGSEEIPENVVLHGLKQRDGKFVVRIYGVQDNPKGGPEASFLRGRLTDFLTRVGMEDSEDFWEGEGAHTLWTAKLFPVCDTIREAVAASLNVYRISIGQGDVDAWRIARRTSLQSGFHNADPDALIAWEKRMGQLIQMDMLAKSIYSKQPVSNVVGLLKDGLTSIQNEWIQEHVATAEFSEKMRLFYYIGKALGGTEGGRYVSRCFNTIRESIMSSREKEQEMRCDFRIVKDSHIVSMPLRVNWGGGWSDTPPYCTEQGGSVLNAAICLNGRMPVRVKLEKLSDRKIVFSSQDMGVYGEFDQIEKLQDVGDPYDPYALQKAALLSTGVLPEHGGDLDEILTRLGGGFCLNTEVVGVPKGSGLGTSSILAAACIKAIFEFLGAEYTEQDLYSHVLVMEQMMSTGGGWQDQVGGVSNGIKYIISEPGLRQTVSVEHVQLRDEVFKELNDRFAIIYTGQRRLARNLLRDVVGRYIGNETESVKALNDIQRIAALMRFELMRGHIDDFAGLLNQHWELSKRIDPGSTNTLIDQIFSSIDDLIDGKMICGAGGGGFLQVVMKKGVAEEDLQKRLKSVFQDSLIGVWKSDLV